MKRRVERGARMAFFKPSSVSASAWRRPNEIAILSQSDPIKVNSL
jgi:hypothetical protein